jgi:hypothetical protein
MMLNDWRTMDEGSGAAKDGTAFLAFGIHDHSPDDAERGVVAGDYWWAIIRWDIWRAPHQWVFSKDGASVWSEPQCWQPLVGPNGEQVNAP